MLRWLWRLIVGKAQPAPCSRNCEWEILEKWGKMRKLPGQDERQLATVYTLRCKTCGDLKDHRSGV